MADFHGIPTAVLENKQLRLEYLNSTAQRLIRLSYRGSANLFADIHDDYIDTPHGKYFIRGGHRLWISPETYAITYIPESSGLQVREVTGGAELKGPVEMGSGVQKIIRIELDPHQAVVRLVHTIVNENKCEITLAPWAITMFNQGGTVLLPQPVGNFDPEGLQSNRLLVLWPYTRFNDPRLVWRDDFILLHAIPALPPAKIGYASTAGWLAYWWNGILFRKSIDLKAGVIYPDHGCNVETYCGDRFVELETLGPLVSLAPGMSTQLTETWELFDSLDVPFVPKEIQKLLTK